LKIMKNKIDVKLKILNKLASGAAYSLAHSLNNFVSIPTAPLDESEAKAFSSNSTSPEVISVNSKDLSDVC